MSKIVLVTGTSTGLGASICVQAASNGHKVYATMRDPSKRVGVQQGARALGVSVEILALDVQDTASVNAAVATIIEREGRIDVLVNNAGTGFARSTE